MTPPPIPARLAHRPTVAGLVVPWIVLETDRGHHLGVVTDARRVRALREVRCQICGQHLDRDRYVIMVRPADRERGFVVEPAMHPECAHYSVKACPMLNGSMEHYRSTPHDMTGRSCADPACKCQIVPADPRDTTLRAGHAADDVEQVWARTATDYQLGHTTDGVLALRYPSAPLKRRPVTTSPHAAALRLIGGAP